VDARQAEVAVAVPLGAHLRRHHRRHCDLKVAARRELLQRSAHVPISQGIHEHTPVDIHVLMKIRKLRVFSLMDPANSGFSLSRNLSCSLPARTIIT